MRAVRCLCCLLTLFLLGSVRGSVVYFEVSELPGREIHHDGFVLPLSDPDDIQHARDLIAQGPDQAGSAIIFAEIASGADGINRNLTNPSRPPWSWHVSQFNGFGDFGIELLDGWPTFVESDVLGWINNTNGQIGFWNYTVTGELGETPGPTPTPIPLPAMLPAGILMLGAVIAGTTWRRVRRTL